MEKPDEKYDIIDFNISNINGEYALICCSEYEELNSNIVRILDKNMEYKIQIYKNKPLILLFNIDSIIRYQSFQVQVSSFNVFKKFYKIFNSNKDMNEMFILARDRIYSGSTFTIYDNKTYELYTKFNFFF